jgi:hypothetical protein
VASSRLHVRSDLNSCNGAGLRSQAQVPKPAQGLGKRCAHPETVTTDTLGMITHPVLTDAWLDALAILINDSSAMGGWAELERLLHLHGTPWQA